MWVHKLYLQQKNMFNIWVFKFQENEEDLLREK